MKPFSEITKVQFFLQWKAQNQFLSSFLLLMKHNETLLNVECFSWNVGPVSNLFPKALSLTLKERGDTRANLDFFLLHEDSVLYSHENVCAEVSCPKWPNKNTIAPLPLGIVYTVTDEIYLVTCLESLEVFRYNSLGSFRRPSKSRPVPAGLTVFV